MAETRFIIGCVECIAELEEGKRADDEVNETEGDCTQCDRPACGDHGRNYPRAGWQHESCHELVDYSRIEEY